MTGLWAPKVLKVLRFDGPFGSKGYGIALSGDEYEVSVTGFTSRLLLVILNAVKNLGKNSN